MHNSSNRRQENQWQQPSGSSASTKGLTRKRGIYRGHGQDDQTGGFLGGSDSAAVIWACTIQIYHIVKNNTLDIPFIFMSVKKSAAYEALLDSGATENFIDPWMVEKLEIGKVPMINPRMVFNVNGTENQEGQVDHYCVLNILQGKKQSTQVFFITNLGNDCLIFRYPWLEEFLPQINWKNRTIIRPPVKLTTIGKSWKIRWANWKLQMNKVSISQQWAEKEGKDQTKAEIPPQFWKHVAVFSEEAAKHFPPSCPEDHIHCGHFGMLSHFLC
jgi:hypothetical protein